MDNARSQAKYAAMQGALTEQEQEEFAKDMVHNPRNVASKDASTKQK